MEIRRANTDEEFITSPIFNVGASMDNNIFWVKKDGLYLGDKLFRIWSKDRPEDPDEDERHFESTGRKRRRTSKKNRGWKVSSISSEAHCKRSNKSNSNLFVKEETCDL